MKKIFYIIAFLGAVAMAMNCSDDIVPAFGSVYGTITDSQTNQPVSGATVVISPGNLSSTTGANGHYEFVDLDPGQYKVQVSANGYESNSNQVTVVAGNKSIQDIAISKIQKVSVLELTTSTLTFNGSTNSLPFNIKNKGNEKFNWTITGMTGKSWLSVDPTNGSLQGGKTAVVVVEINQNNLTKDEDATLIVSTENESASIKIIAKYESKKPNIQVSVTTLDFGTENTQMNFTLSNTGNAASKAITIAPENGTPWLSVDPTFITSLEASASKTISVIVNRAVLSEGKTSVVHIIHDGSTIDVTVHAEPSPKPVLSIDKTALDFGTENTQMSFNLSNTGNADSKAIAITPENGASWISVNPTFIESLSASSSKTVYVTVNRSMISESKTAVIHITHDGNTTDVTVHAAPVPKPVLNVDKTTLDFGSDNTSETVRLSSYNAPSTYSAKVESGESWLQVSPANGYLKAYNASDNSTVASLQITVARNDLAPGNYSGKIVISENQGSSVSIVVSMEVKKQGPVVTNGLKAYYQFENDFNDSTENENDGYGMNSPQFVAGVGNNSKAAKFSASSYMKVGTTGLIDNKSQSISFWVKNPGDGIIYTAYCAEYKSDSPFMNLEVENGQLRYTVSPYYNWYLSYRNDQKVGCFSHPTIYDDKWHHIVLLSDYSYAEVTSVLYIDGKKVSTAKEWYYGTTQYDKCHSFQLGGKVTHYDTVFDGSSMTIDNFRVYHRSLSDDEIKAIFNAKQ